MYSQMTSLEDIGIVFVVLFFYVGEHPPMTLYVCTKDMKLSCFREAIERFLFQFNRFFQRCVEMELDPINMTAFREWYKTGYVWMDYPFRFSFLRFFIDQKYVQKHSVSLGLLSCDLHISRPGFHESVSEKLYLSEIDTRTPFPEKDDYVLLRVDCK